MVSAAALAALETMLLKDLVSHAGKQGQYFLGRLKELQTKFPALIEDVRGLGLLIGAQLKKPAAPLVLACEKRGLLVGTAGEQVLRFLPPLVVSEKEIDAALEKLEGAIDDEAKKG